MKKWLPILMFFMTAGCHDMQGDFFRGFSKRGETLNTSVESALLQSGEFNSASIHVTTENGVVQLTGYVKTIRESDRAQMIASQVPGVKTVDNQLIVKK